MKLRAANIQRLQSEEFDVLIVGGGINGAASAAALAAKGVRVALIERGDFAGETSSASSNLIWGGIKYMENMEFRLVRRLCKSRNRLARHFPSKVREIRFTTSIASDFRWSATILYLGALVYWALGLFQTRAPKYLGKQELLVREPLIAPVDVQAGMEYSDCYLYDNDARFVFGFVRSAMDRGCAAANYVESLGSDRDDDGWITQVEDRESGKRFAIRSRVLINACGPWVDTHNQLSDRTTMHHHLFSKGVHLVVPRLTNEDRVLAFFASDGRLFFVIPMGPRTCVGTTDTQVESPETEVTDEDRAFILDNINELLNLQNPLTTEDIVAERCGVRPLVSTEQNGDADWINLSRRHVIEQDESRHWISIFGGKLTDCINVGEEVSELVADMGVELTETTNPWYGEAGAEEKQKFIDRARSFNLDAMTDPDSTEPLTERLWRRYGQRAMVLLDSIQQDSEGVRVLVVHSEYLRCELELAAEYEMVTRLEDLFRRRSKIAMVTRREDILRSPHLHEACQILFADRAQEKLDEYRNSADQ